ncbi:methyltransferase-like protein 22 isoform X9 [Canis lupus dingo]|uniref:methyltransferase-like protein 22 isoform X9 n=1 Tax=Canis lupus dingo TaxID=286419 RepID=UPI0020C21191|nr:methyltransferase-like protein 22 isoform X9 [Canis lupus dingo]
MPQVTQPVSGRVAICTRVCLTPQPMFSTPWPPPWKMLASRCGGVPCSWQTTSCSNGTSSKDAPCWSLGRAQGWPASSRPPWHVPFTVQAVEPGEGCGDGWCFMACPSVISDVGTDLLAMCQRNIALNGHLTAAAGEAQRPFCLGSVVKVKELDWLQDDLCTDPEVPFSWSQEDVSDLYSHTTILLAAEVFYDDDLTDALFKTLSRLAHKLKNACTAILSVEKRLNFTLRHLDVTCEAYDHFRSWLQRLERLADGQLRFVVEPVEASFPQRLVYERIQQLHSTEFVWLPCMRSNLLFMATPPLDCLPVDGKQSTPASEDSGFH